MRSPNIIETISGAAFDYTNPKVNLRDVAHGLANVCRFGGHTSRFYSVAEHSVLVANMVSEIAPELTLVALWHDAHEAYIGDLPTPLKAIVGDEYKAIAAGIDAAVRIYLDLEDMPIRHPAIKLADELAVMYEASHLKPGPGWEFTRKMKHPQAERALTLPLGREPAAAAALFENAHRRLDPDPTPPHMRRMLRAFTEPMRLGDLNPVVA